MKVSRPASFALPLLVCFGCGEEPRHEETKLPNESCLIYEDEAIAAAISQDMKALDSERQVAAACAAENPPLSSPTGTKKIPMDVTGVKTSYQAWLNYVASATTWGSVGSTSDYKALATAAQSDFLKACHKGEMHAPDCGTDVTCQLTQVTQPNFDYVGGQILSTFKGCPDPIRQRARDELISHHSWN